MNKVLLVMSLGLVGCAGTTFVPTAGVQGPQGAPGVSCEVTPVAANSLAPNGGSLITCASSQSLILNGSNGLNGTVINPVQFCPQYGPTTYPNNFPEQALCISGNLYAVYWTGTEAFFSEVVPGYYESTSPQGCNFTVLPNCKIQN
jgi:hypothetical protein